MDNHVEEEIVIEDLDNLSIVTTNEKEGLLLGPCGGQWNELFSCLMKLQNKGLLNNVKLIVANGMETIPALLFAVGYTPEEMMNLNILKLVFNDISKLNVSFMITNFGLVDQTVIGTILHDLIRKKLGRIVCTMSNLHHATGIKLHFSPYNATQRRLEKFSEKNDISVIQVILLSCIPFAFGQIKYNDCVYFDGSIYSSYPINDYRNTIAINVNNIYDLASLPGYTQEVYQIACRRNMPSIIDNDKGNINIEL